MREFVITRATESDIKEIVLIDRDCLDGFWSETSYLGELENDNSEFLVISAGGEVLGFACVWFYCQEGHLIVFAIKPEYQGQGLGSALLWQILKRAHHYGAEWVVLEVRVSNTRAIKLYEKFGFVAIGTRKEYYADNGEDALVLWCKGVHTVPFKEKLIKQRQEIADRLQERGWLWLERLKQLQHS